MLLTDKLLYHFRNPGSSPLKIRIFHHLLSFIIIFPPHSLAKLHFKDEMYALAYQLTEETCD